MANLGRSTHTPCNMCRCTLPPGFPPTHLHPLACHLCRLAQRGQLLGPCLRLPLVARHPLRQLARQQCLRMNGSQHVAPGCGTHPVGRLPGCADQPEPQQRAPQASRDEVPAPKWQVQQKRCCKGHLRQHSTAPRTPHAPVGLASLRARPPEPSRARRLPRRPCLPGVHGRWRRLRPSGRAGSAAGPQPEWPCSTGKSEGSNKQHSTARAA